MAHPKYLKGHMPIRWECHGVWAWPQCFVKIPEWFQYARGVGTVKVFIDLLWLFHSFLYNSTFAKYKMHIQCLRVKVSRKLPVGQCTATFEKNHNCSWPLPPWGWSVYYGVDRWNGIWGGWLLLCCSNIQRRFWIPLDYIHRKYPCVATLKGQVLV